MPFATHTKVRIAQVDPAGIVFYPRYFEMLNNAVEDWFDEALGLDMATMHMDKHIGVPTVKLDVTFTAPSRLGEILTITIVPRAVGRSSCNVHLAFTCNESMRLKADMVIVCMDLIKAKSVPWPASLLKKLEAGLISD
jgi:4-hydroxybenzoyl-CoA thioesterase